MSKYIYILHKNGADSHYRALDYLLIKNNQKLVYREFSVFSKIVKSLLKLDVKALQKQCVNLFFLIELIFTSNKKVVLGIAPFDKKLGVLLKVLNKHTLYYHTSWANWDGSFVPKSKKVSEALKGKWKVFIEGKCSHIYTVTETSKEQLCEFYEVDSSKISVVNHSFDHTKFIYKANSSLSHSFIYAGRLRTEKGIEELLQWFSVNPTSNLTIIGKGYLEAQVEEYAQKHQNISFLGYIKDKKKLISIFNEHNFMILNSFRTKKWEELFGMVLIEGMACGLIPVASNHVGPRSIIEESFGYLYKEGEVASILDIIISKKVDLKKKQEAQRVSQNYSIENISKTWKTILA